MSQDLIEKFCLKDDLSTYDPHDIWKTDFGIEVKKIFYNNKYLGAIPAGLLVVFDFFINNNKRWLYRKQEYPIVRALATLSILSAFKIWKKKEYIEFAKRHLDWLANNYSKGYNGYCWGLSQRWVSKNTFYDRNIPHVTHTPYALEAFVEYRDLEKDIRYDEIIKSVFYFLEQDVPVLLDEDDKMAMSYSPIKESRIVINANAYILYMYSLLLLFLPNKKYDIENRIRKVYNFVVDSQNGNGSWFYYADSKPGNFIDCFHSCLVMKNLLKAKNIVELKGVDSVLKKGIKYLEENLLDKKIGLYRRFAISDNPSFIQFDLYDNAEVLNLLVLLGEIDKAADLLDKIRNYFIVKNDIYSDIDIFQGKRNKNMLRWAVMPFIYACSNYWSQICAAS